MVPGSPSQASSSFGFGHLVGAAGDAIAWGRLLVFFGAVCLSDVVGFVLDPLIHGYSLPSPVTLLTVLFGNIVLTGAVLVAFRWVRNPYLAALAATGGYMVVMLPLRLFRQFGFSADMLEQWQYLLFVQMNSFVWTFLTLLALVAAVAVIRPLWLALLVGAVGAALGSFILSSLLSLILLESSFDLTHTLMSLIGPVVSAGALALAFWGGLRLLGLGTVEAFAPAMAAAGPERLSKGFYVGSIAGAFGLVGVFGIAAIALAPREREAAFALLGMAVLAGIYGGVVNVVLWYKAWAAIQDGHARTTPGKAIGLLFIPFFNFYWGFQALWGWAKDYNAYTARHGIQSPRMPEGLFLTYVILCLVAFVPAVGVLASLAALVIVVVMAAKICDGVNALSR